VGEHRETWRVDSAGFEQWLARSYYLATRGAPGRQAIDAAVNVLVARARFDDEERQVGLRLARNRDRIFLDLGNDSWEVVEIHDEGWRIVTDPPVRFVRTAATQALPNPVRGASIDALREFVNIGDEGNWRLLVGFILSSYSPDGPYPLLCLYGEQGVAKSTAARVVQALIDPSAAGLRSQPRDVRDLLIAAVNNWLLVFDNVSELRPWLSDALCRLSTGGAYTTRRLYTDSDETVLHAKRPAVITSIEEVVSRSDLLDRSFVLSLPPIHEGAYRHEEEFWRAFETGRPAILGALLDALAVALKRKNELEVPTLPRLADAAVLITAAEPALGWPEGAFLRALERNRDEVHQLAVEAAAIGPSLYAIARETFEGTASELLEELNLLAGEQTRKQPGWPKSAASLSNRLRRLAPNLRGLGVEVTIWRETTGKKRRLVRISALTSAPTPATNDPPNREDTATRARPDAGGGAGDGGDGSLPASVCRFPSHLGPFWATPDGRRMCGICHPRPGTDPDANEDESSR
jgi:hypothetical protein